MLYLNDSVVALCSEHVGQLLHCSVDTQEIRYTPECCWIITCLENTSSAAEYTPIIQPHPNTVTSNLNGSVEEDFWAQSSGVDETQEDRCDLEQLESTEVVANLSSDVGVESSPLSLQMFQIEQPHPCTVV